MATHEDTHLDAGKTFCEPCYPHTASFAPGCSETASRINEGRRCRRPGGMYRGKREFSTIGYPPTVNESIRGKNGDPH